MIAALHLYHWAAAVMRQQNPVLVDVPLVIGGHAGESAPVLATSTEAEAAGVRVGMPLKQAWALCPEAVFLPPDEVSCNAAYDVLLDLLWTYSDQVEPPAEPFHTETSVFCLDLGMPRETEAQHLMQQLLTTLEQEGLTARIGLAANPFTASAGATRGTRAVTLILPGQERAFLAPLPVALLPLENVQAQRLTLLGIHTLGQFAALPRSAMLTQFGMHGPHLHALARGEDRRTLTPVPCPHSESLFHECEPPVENRQLLEGLLAHLSVELTARLAALNMTCPEVELAFELHRGETLTLRHRPRDPVAGENDLLRLLLRLLDQLSLSGPVYGITIHLRHLQATQARQLTLFGDDLLSGQIPAETLERLTARHGAGLFYEIRRAERPASAYLPETYRLAGVSA